MKVQIIGMEWLEPIEAASDEAALACLAALVIDVAAGTNRPVSTIGFAARKVGDCLVIQPVDRAAHAEALEACGAVKVAQQLREVPPGSVPLVNCGGFESPDVVPLTPSVVSPGGDA